MPTRRRKPPFVHIDNTESLINRLVATLEDVRTLTERLTQKDLAPHIVKNELLFVMELGSSRFIYRKPKCPKPAES